MADMMLGAEFGSMLAGPAAAGTAGAGAAGGDLLGYINALFMGGQGIGNFGLGLSQLDWEKSMQNQAWAREDTAVQRRVADLRAAGLSPTLAAGSAAQSTNPINVTAPRMDIDPVGAYQATAAKDAQIDQLKTAVMSQKADIARTKAQTDYIRSQKAKTDQSTYMDSVLQPLRQEAIRLQNEFSDATMNDRIRRIADNTELTDEQIKDQAVQAKVDLEKAQAGLANAGIYEKAARTGLIGLEIWNEPGRVDSERTKAAAQIEYYKALTDSANRMRSVQKGSGQIIGDIGDVVGSITGPMADIIGKFDDAVGLPHNEHGNEY